VPPPKDFGVLPAGEYTACITASEMKATQRGDGSYLSLEFTILGDGEYANRKLWENLNLDNPNQTTVQIAESNLGAICKAIAESAGNPQLETPNDSSDLHDIPITITLAVKKDNNVIRKWSGIQGAGRAQPQQNNASNPAQGGQQQFGGQPQQGQSVNGQQGGQGTPWGQNRG